MKNIFKALILTSILLSGTGVFAQYENTSGQKETGKTVKTQSPLNKIYLGGNIGGGWWSDGANFEISPIIGYRITNDLTTGVRLTYLYSYYSNYGSKYSYHDFGGSVFMRYYMFKFLFVHAEFEELSSQYYLSDGSKSRRWVPGLFLGGGLYQHFGNTFMSVAVLFNVLDSEYSPYTNPIIRIGFGVGL
jgi:hypothetical protein